MVNLARHNTVMEILDDFHEYRKTRNSKYCMYVVKDRYVFIIVPFVLSIALSQMKGELERTAKLIPHSEGKKIMAISGADFVLNRNKWITLFN